MADSKPPFNEPPDWRGSDEDRTNNPQPEDKIALRPEISIMPVADTESIGSYRTRLYKQAWGDFKAMLKQEVTPSGIAGGITLLASLILLIAGVAPLLSVLPVALYVAILICFFVSYRLQAPAKLDVARQREITEQREQIKALTAKSEQPNIECEVIAVHPESPPVVGDFYYIFTVHLYLKNSGKITNIRDYKLRMLQGEHAHEAQKVAVKNYYLERQEPRLNLHLRIMELQNISYELTDLESMRNTPLDQSGRDGWLRFNVGSVRWKDECNEEGRQMPKVLEITIIDGEGVPHIFECPESEWKHEGRIRTYADRR
jgi:hypothetical protein